MDVFTSYKDPITGKEVHSEGNLDDQPEDVRRNWYAGVCSNSEVERILNMKDGHDYLLKLRAETILENTRLWRYFMHLIRNERSNWSLERYFEAKNYIEFKNALKEEDRLRCENVTFGSIYSNEPNGLIFQSPFGICTTFSVSLRYFTMFSNLALLDFEGRVPESISMNGLRIASRLMLDREALDFEMDPRGIIPPDIQKSLMQSYPFQSMFLAGHEYSHYLLGHLDDKCVSKKGIIKAHFKDETDYRMLNAYTTNQKQEFEADITAMNLPVLNDQFYGTYYYYTLLWFASLSIYEAVEDCIFPPFGQQTHPGAKARYQNIIENARRPKYFDRRLFCEKIPAIIEFYRELMINDVSLNFDAYEQYGSVYLAAANTEWRGRELIDRVD